MHRIWVGGPGGHFVCDCVCVCMFVKGQTQRPPSAAAVLDQSECCLAALS